MKYLRFLSIGLISLALANCCIPAFFAARKNIFEVSEVTTESPSDLPHDFPPELIYHDAWFTHGSTGMMKAEVNPESHAHFMTYEPRDSVLAFYRGVEGWEMRFEGRDSADVYTFALTKLGELADFQFVAELVPSTMDDGKPVIHIDIAYGPGIGVRYPDYFYEYAPGP